MVSVIRVLWAAFGLLQFALAAAVAAESPGLAAVFLLAGLSLLFAVIRTSGVALAIGIVFAFAGPLVVGLSGIEPFELIHHVVRGAIIALLAVGWLRWVRPASRKPVRKPASAPAAAPARRRTVSARPARID